MNDEFDEEINYLAISLKEYVFKYLSDIQSAGTEPQQYAELCRFIIEYLNIIKFKYSKAEVYLLAEKLNDKYFITNKLTKTNKQVVNYASVVAWAIDLLVGEEATESKKILIPLIEDYAKDICNNYDIMTWEFFVKLSKKHGFIFDKQTENNYLDYQLLLLRLGY